MTPTGPAAWVYILRCADGSLYTGWSNDVERRLASHRAGRASRMASIGIKVWPPAITTLSSAASAAQASSIDAGRT